MMNNYNDGCIFCNIVQKKEKAWVVHEDSDFIAFLTPFPNTPGFTVIATKQHLDSNVFTLPDDVYTSLLLFVKKVTAILNHSLHTHRTGLIIEGMGVDHAHVKLIPMHGLSGGEWQAVRSNVNTFSSTYHGFLSSHDGPRMSDKELDDILSSIKATISSL